MNLKYNISSMKKKILKKLGAIVILVIAGYNIYVLEDGVKLSGLALSNVEALAENEWVTYYCRMSPWTWKCKNTVYGTVCYCNM